MAGEFRRLYRGLSAAFSDDRVRGLMAMTFALIAVASVFYRYAEGWNLLDSVYFSVITIATIGYGDLYPQTGWHTHALDYVITAITDCQMMLEEPDGATREVSVPAGSAYQRAEGVEHNVVNAGDGPMSFVEMELK